MPERPAAGARDGLREGEGGGSEGRGDNADADSLAREGDGRGNGKPTDIYRLCYELAGIVGVHPGQWTLRGLVWAAEGAQKERWNHTSSVVAQQYSIHRDPKKRQKPYQPHEFNPFYEPPKVKPRIITPELFDEIFKD